MTKLRPVNDNYHDPHEKRPTNRIYWACFALVAVQWILIFALDGFDDVNWDYVMLGFNSGLIYLGWATEIRHSKGSPWLKGSGHRR